MNKQPVYGILFGVLFIALLQVGCNNNDPDPDPDCGCPAFDFISTAPYEEPAWHPSGSVIGFNHIPIKEIHYTYGYDCPRQARYVYDMDSIGFWLVNADGSDMRRILPYTLSTPAWSPDGTKIAFSNGAQISIMPFDGEKFDTTAIVTLTDEDNNFFPAWSPDGEWIAYDSNTGSLRGQNYLWKMKKNGEAKRQLLSEHQGEERMPDWGQDFSIIFQRYVGVTYPEIIKIDASGNNMIRLTENNMMEKYPKFSPNSQFIAFIAPSADGTGTQLFKLNSDGTGLTQLTTDGCRNYSWSPDGRIVYVRSNKYDRIDTTEGCLWIMNADGTSKQPLTYNSMEIFY